MKLELELANGRTEEGLERKEKRKMEKSKQMKRRYEVKTQKVDKNLSLEKMGQDMEEEDDL
ncbi:hypothetical protein E2C01_052152 [Portunus trituberculatus]|uniref:Uncharacterized protein n=1 Tax=Portunus trituberculatus TaxID=210409 RepID=A0A5B7GLL2_PORTR|nr:hypothetical protein [Portunus trituberculatus]